MDMKFINIAGPGATDQFAKSGFVIVSSTVMPYRGEHSTTYLGRPWKPFATVLVMRTYLADIVEPRGWMAWNNEEPPTTLRYGEYHNSGPGSVLGRRVNWTGYEPRMTDEAAQTFSGATDQFAKSGFVIVSSTVIALPRGTSTHLSGTPLEAFCDRFSYEDVSRRHSRASRLDGFGNNEEPPTTLRYGEYPQQRTGIGSWSTRKLDGLRT
ncbi:Pectin lyase fold/virulence factor protein [Raphanus sativus]|nr:Pectin lyase fold/virulence factor protein [Raphanus sativus]